jgi:glycine/D-amino acid oxidase-like deaminating enzyme
MRPYWTARLADARKTRFPVLDDALRVDVAVVGGGLIGCTVAYLVAASGARVALLEAKRIGQQATAAAPGVIVPEPAVPLATLQAIHGRRAARAMWEMSRRAALDFVSLLHRLGIRAEVDPVDIVNYLSAREDGRGLEREGSLRRAMGLEGQYLAPGKADARLRTTVSGAIRVTPGAVFDPYRACLGLARAARSQKAKLFERSPVVKIRPADDGVEIETPKGHASAARVIVATGGPTRLFQPMARRFTPLVTYRVLTEPLPARLRRYLPGSPIVLREATCPAHLLRPARGRRLLFAGAERLRLPERSRPAALVQHAAQLMYELSLVYPELSGIRADYAWDTLVSASDDGLPYIGPHRHYPHHLFALGAGRSDGSAALLAARILLRCCTDSAEKPDALWSFGR